MSLALPQVRAVKSFENSAALPPMTKRESSRESSSKRKSPSGKLPTIDGQPSSLPSINSHNEHQQESVSSLPKVSKKKKLDAIDSEKENPAQDSGSKSESGSKSRRRDRRSDEKQMVKDQVAVAVQAVREVFQTPKGRNILELETKVAKAKATGEYTKCKVKRKTDQDSLGISFTIPARVMALGWESGQHLVVTDTAAKPGVKSTLAISDVVVAVDDVEVHSIDDLKACVAGKKKMNFKCIRMTGPIAEEELVETQARIEKMLKSAVKAKVKASIKARRKRDDNGGGEES
jgi:hypothetical protein